MKLSVIGLRGFPLIEGGVEKHSESLYPKLDENIDITVYRRKVYVSTYSTYDHISFIDLPSTKMKGVEPFIHSFFASLHALFKRPDVVHYHNIGPALFSPIMKLKRIPVVLTYHSPNYEHKKWGWFARRILLLGEKIALKTADKIIFVNSYQMAKYNENIKKKSVFVPNGINNLPESLNTNYLNKLGVEKGKYILSVGRITQEKGFDTLIKAFKLAKIDGIKLVIVGGVEFEDEYMKQLQELSRLENVIFTGYIYGDNLYQLYTYAGIYVLASYNEGFPLVLLEAMKYGLDILVSDIPATHLVSLDKEAYFECANYEMLASKLVERSKNFKKKTYDLSKYNWYEIARAMSGIFYEVVGTKK
ncbi:MAG: glycosyltransferase family 4 protein [Bacilli bacterium]|uniref:glycosyltransferase family 4 protein n=1 Tax=Anaerorhabdus sp. TaxID=1872524 RepID=UPI002FCC2CC6